MPDFQIGKNGIEQAYDDSFRGLAGTSHVEVNAVGRVIRELKRDEGTPGHDMSLTLDMGLQQYTYYRLGEEMAALEAGIINPSHNVFCRGWTQLGTSRFHCWKRGGHGNMDLHNGIKQSCDVFFYDVARRVGLDKIAEMANRLGIGVPAPLGLRGEKSGFMPTREWKQAQFGVPWQPGETLGAGIGQGFILATPLQLAVMTARIVNGGFAVMPHLTRQQIGADGPGEPIDTQYESLGISNKSLAIVIRGMIGVVNAPRGTAGRSRITEKWMEMGGNTGTSQVRLISKSERIKGVVKNKDKPWEERDHALFLGFAPIHEPRYACACVVEHGGGGSRAAAPVVKDVLLETQRRDPSRTSPLPGLAQSAPPTREG